MDALIIEVVEIVARHNGRAYPRMVQAWGVPSSERQLRRDMAKLAQEGKIIRLGQRGGYLPATTGKVARVLN